MRRLTGLAAALLAVLASAGDAARAVTAVPVDSFVAAEAVPAAPPPRIRVPWLYRLLDAVPAPDGVLDVAVRAAVGGTDAGPAEQRFAVDMAGGAATLGYGPWPGWYLRAALPWWRWSGDRRDPAGSASGVGDLAVRLAVPLPRPWTGAHLALDLRGTLPTGDADRRLGAGRGGGFAGLAWTQRIWRDAAVPELRLHLEAGHRWRDGRLATAPAGAAGLLPLALALPPPADGDGWRDDADLIGAAVSFRRRTTALYLEYTRWSYTRADVAAAEEPRFLTFGLHWGGETGWRLAASFDVALADDDPATAFTGAAPDLTTAVAVGYGFGVGGRDSDGDGIPDRRDACPHAAEDRDGYRDADGCPDLDNDGDGVPDDRDGAPLRPEDRDGFQDDDGVPDPDNDQDGIPDVVDRCPDRPEDFDGYQDTDGCPEEFLDADHDGIADADDLCPHAAEDRDGWEDGDGCPDPDNDLDGIPDTVDQCPDEAETYNGIADDDGCPEPEAAPADSSAGGKKAPSGGEGGER